MDRIYADIGARMRAIRKTLRMTQAEVANAVGVDPSFYGQIERGSGIPSIRTLLAVARVFGIEPADLLPSRREPRNDVQQQALSRALSELRPNEKKMILGVVSDMVYRFKSRKKQRRS